MKEVKVPKGYEDRLAAVAKQHKFASAKVLANDLVERGLKALGAPDGALETRLEHIVDSHGYSSQEEAVEHLLERGLGAYESSETDPEKFKARLRGLGYLD